MPWPIWQMGREVTVLWHGFWQVLTCRSEFYDKVDWNLQFSSTLTKTWSVCGHLKWMSSSFLWKGPKEFELAWTNVLQGECFLLGGLEIQEIGLIKCVLFNIGFQKPIKIVPFYRLWPVDPTASPSVESWVLVPLLKIIVWQCYAYSLSVRRKIGHSRKIQLVVRIWISGIRLNISTMKMPKRCWIWPKIMTRWVYEEEFQENNSNTGSWVSWCLDCPSRLTRGFAFLGFWPGVSREPSNAQCLTTSVWAQLWANHIADAHRSGTHCYWHAAIWSARVSTFWRQMLLTCCDLECKS